MIAVTRPGLLALAVACTLASGCSGAGSTVGSASGVSGASAAGATAPGAGGSNGAGSVPGTAPAGSATTAPTASPGAAVAGGYAPLDQPGPALDVPAATLAASLTCSPLVGTSSRHTILLVPGTTLIPSVNFYWNYERAFTADAMPWCAVTLPENAMGNVATAGEYVVSAIRTIAQTTGRSVDIYGYSQGGMVPRWAFRFWPDTRALVDSFVAIDPSNHGTIDAYPVCAAGCADAFWQQQTGSHFLAALNSGAETFAGIAYTVAYSDTDEVVVPNEPVASSSSLSGGGGTIVNISVQSICPTDVSDHLAMGTYDPVAYALAMDAYAHDTIANASDVPPTTCAMPLNPGVDPRTFAQNYAAYDAYIANTIATTPTVSAEPTLPPYVYAK